MRRAAAVLALAWPTAALLAQPPDLSGTWRIDRERSRLAAAADLAGLAAQGAPDTLHVTQPANGTLLVESQVNESHARYYRPGVMVTTPVTVGPAGHIATTSRWEGRTLVAEGRRESNASGAALVTEIREAYSLGADGRLTVEVTALVAGEKVSSTLVYARIQDVGACQSWPTPCRPYPGSNR